MVKFAPRVFLALVLLGLVLCIPVLAQEDTIKVMKYQAVPASPELRIQAGEYAYIELATGKGTIIQTSCKFEKPHPMTIPMKDGKTTPVYQPDGKPILPDATGKPVMGENNCAYLSEHVGESINLFVGEVNALMMATPEETLVGKDHDAQLKAMQAQSKLFATNYVRAGRWQNGIIFHIHEYHPGTPPGFTDSNSTDRLVELTVLSEQVTQTEITK